MLDMQHNQASGLLQNLQTACLKYAPKSIHCDQTDVEGALRPTADSILSEFGHVDVLINNAASDGRQLTLEVRLEDWDLSVAINLRHHFVLTQALMPRLLAAQSASVINASSISWTVPATGLAPYTATKAEVRGLTRTLAHESGPSGVTFNSITLGAVAPERQTREIYGPGDREMFQRVQALKIELSRRMSHARVCT